jgi:uncharacterized protein (TIGR02302 family)
MTGARRERPTTDPLDRIILRTRLAMAAERALRAVWPLATLAALLWAALAFGLAEIAPLPLLLVLLGLAALAALALAGWGARRLRWPTRAEAVARIDATLPGRPLAALDDSLALGAGDAGARGVWDAHVARMRALAARARPARPDLRLASEDPWAIRLVALVALIAAVMFARGDAVGGLGAALAPSGSAAVATGPAFEAWAEPPAYTGRPSLYLPEVAAEPAVPVPAGTTITLRVYGDAARFALRESVSGAEAPALDTAAEGIGMARFEVVQSGSVGLDEGGEPLGAWSFVMEPDRAPEIALAEPPSRTPAGEMQLSYEASDDYGIASARAEIALDLDAVDRRYGLAADPVERPALTLDLPMPMAGGGPDLAEILVEDVSKHPWVGLPVTVRLTAEDAVGQTGTSPVETVLLPGRRFYNPVAAALVEQRRDLLWSPGNAERVGQVLRAITHRPEAGFDNPRAYLMTRLAIRRLAPVADRSDPTPLIEEVSEMLWRAALLLEEGSLGDAAERLARAKERLQEALRGDASDEEIAQLMDELRQATRDYMEQLAQEAIRRGETQQAEAPPPGQTMTQDQIQALMDRIQELSEQGRRAEAEALLEMLQQLLENMEMQLAEGGQGQGQGQGGQGQQSLQDLGDALREQQGLADDSFSELQRQFRDGRSGQQGEGESQGQGQAQGQGQGQALAERQEALRELLEDLQRDLPGEAGEAAREALRQAERDMEAARDGLRRDDTAGALDRQADAIDNLREGLRGLADDLRQAENGGQGGQPGEGADAFSQESTDPLGRPLGSRGGIGTAESMLPGADAMQRARDLLDEIRRRSGDLGRPELELDYLRRLLDRF